MLKKLKFYDGGTVPEVDSAEELVGKLRLPGSTPQSLRMAAWNGHSFEVVHAKARSNNFVLDHAGDAHEIAMIVYYPVDPRIGDVDVDGAVRAYPNADSSGWLFAHTDEGTHHDYELVMLAACDGVFQPLFRQYQVDALDPVSSVRLRGEKRFKLLAEFYGQTINTARALARSRFLGEREQEAHPREGWLDRDITAAVAAIKAIWTESRDADLTEISSGLIYIDTSLAMPAVETRWEMKARKAAEAAAAETQESE